MAKMTTRFTTICTMQRKYKKHLFYVDIVMDHKEQTYEAWIWEDRYGVKSLVIGVPWRYYNTILKQTATNTVDGFIEMAMDDYNFKNSADLYIEQYMDGEES